MRTPCAPSLAKRACPLLLKVWPSVCCHGVCTDGSGTHTRVALVVAGKSMRVVTSNVRQSPGSGSKRRAALVGVEVCASKAPGNAAAAPRPAARPMRARRVVFMKENSEW